MILRDVPGPARALAIIGLVPILVPVVLAWALPPVERLIAFDVLVHYAAVVLAFLGAVHWGVAMGSAEHSDDHSGAEEKALWWRFGWSVTPALIAWLATQMVLPAALLVLMIGFTLAYLYDAHAARRGWVPGWYRRLRRPLTLIVLIALAGALGRLWY